MKCLLFRKIHYLDNDFYELYKIDEDFQKTDDFADFETHDKDYFYIEVDENKELTDEVLHTFCYFDEDDDCIFVSDDDLASELKEEVAFQEEYQKITKEEVKNIVDKLCQKNNFQKKAIMRLIKRIYYNHDIVNGTLSINRKKKMKRNIMFFGNEKREDLVKLMEEELTIPYVDITLDIKKSINVRNIIEGLVSKSQSDEEASRGVVFVKGNIGDLEAIFEHNSMEPLLSLINTEEIEHKGHTIDFRTLTFVFMPEMEDKINMEPETLFEFYQMSGCDYFIIMSELSYYQKMFCLLGDKGILKEYHDYFKSCGKELSIEEGALEYLVHFCQDNEYGMDMIENIIDSIIGNATINGVEDFCITIDVIKNIIKRDKEEKVYDKALKPIYNKILENVVGQDEHVKRILYTILENRRMANKEDLDDPKQYISNILIRGESGGGKTFIINNIAKLLNIPLYIANATQYTEEGYVGADVTDMLVELYRNADENLEEAEKGILVIDEIDKKANNEDNKSDVSRGAVLNSLLKIVEGAPISINVGGKNQNDYITFDTSRLTVICSGAFEDIEKIRDERVKKAKGNDSIGFSNNRDKKTRIDTNIIDKDYVTFGMMRQFMARLSVIVNLNKNDAKSLKSIMLKSKSSALKTEAFKLNDKGIEVEYTDDFYDKVAEEAIELNDGVRGVDKTLQRILSSIHIEDIEPETVQKIVFNGDVVDNPNAIIIVPREKEKIKQYKKDSQ